MNVNQWYAIWPTQIHLRKYLGEVPTRKTRERFTSSVIASVTVGANRPQPGLLQNAREKRVMTMHARLEIREGINRGVHPAPQGAACRFERLEDLSMRQLVTDDQHVDVALGRFSL